MSPSNIPRIDINKWRNEYFSKNSKTSKPNILSLSDARYKKQLTSRKSKIGNLSRIETDPGNSIDISMDQQITTPNAKPKVSLVSLKDSRNQYKKMKIDSNFTDPDYTKVTKFSQTMTKKSAHNVFAYRNK